MPPVHVVVCCGVQTEVAVCGAESNHVHTCGCTSRCEDGHVGGMGSSISAYTNRCAKVTTCTMYFIELFLYTSKCRHWTVSQTSHILLSGFIHHKLMFEHPVGLLPCYSIN